MKKNPNKKRTLSVFLCHSKGDKDAVRELYGRLKGDGFDPWLDDVNLMPGQHWQSVIPREVRNADIVLVCLSRGSVDKRGYVQKEIKIALDVADEQPEDTIFVIPVKLEECNVPERLSEWHWVNLFEEGGYEKLVRSLRQRANTLEPRAKKSSITKASRHQPFKVQDNKAAGPHPGVPEQRRHSFRSTSMTASWIFGSALLIFLFISIFALPNPTEFQKTAIRFLMALTAAFFAFFFVGGVLLEGTIKGLFISATGGFVLFILIQFVFDPFKVIQRGTSIQTPAPSPSPTSIIPSPTATPTGQVTPQMSPSPPSSTPTAAPAENEGPNVSGSYTGFINFPGKFTGEARLTIVGDQIEIISGSNEMRGRITTYEPDEDTEASGDIKASILLHGPAGRIMNYSFSVLVHKSGNLISIKNAPDEDTEFSFMSR